MEEDPKLILVLGDLYYNGKKKCGLELIEPIAERTEIARYLIQVG